MRFILFAIRSKVKERGAFLTRIDLKILLINHSSPAAAADRWWAVPSGGLTGKNPAIDKIKQFK
jgi:hypothetical protein